MQDRITTDYEKPPPPIETKTLHTHVRRILSNVTHTCRAQRYPNVAPKRPLIDECDTHTSCMLSPALTWSCKVCHSLVMSPLHTIVLCLWLPAHADLARDQVSLDPADVAPSNTVCECHTGQYLESCVFDRCQCVSGRERDERIRAGLMGLTHSRVCLSTQK